MRLCVKPDPLLSKHTIFQGAKECLSGRGDVSAPELVTAEDKNSLATLPLFFLGKRAYLTRRQIRPDLLLAKTVRNQADLMVAISSCRCVAESLLLKMLHGFGSSYRWKKASPFISRGGQTIGYTKRE